MLEAINTCLVNALDYVFGWMLLLPRDLSLFSVAILTSASLSLIRKWTTDQAWLARADADTKRLHALIREAKQARDREAVARYKATITRIKVKAMKFEGKPLLWSLVPVALLATWAFSRLAFVPPPAGATLTVRAHLSKSYIGQTIHMAPEEGVETVNGWFQTVVEDARVPPTNLWDKCNNKVCTFFNMLPQPEAVAEWQIVSKDTNPHVMKIRFGGRTYAQEVLAGKRQYAPALTVYLAAPVQAVELVMKPMKLFGGVGAIDFLFLPPWLVAYLLIAIPFVTILRRVLRIY
ncbi:MAG: hypothetical protein ACOYOU_01665 [Kiritimatiellia bacterium]